MAGIEVRNFKARYVFPVLQPPIPDGVVSIAGGRIIAVGTKPIAGSVEDLGSVALLPGLINAHTHLEFSLLERPIGRPGMSFSEWLRQLVEQFRRVGLPSEETATPGDLSKTSSPEEAIRSGLWEMIRSGTTAVADIAQPGFPDLCWTHSGMKAVVFLELRAPTTIRVPQALQEAHRTIESWQSIQSAEASVATAAVASRNDSLADPQAALDTESHLADEPATVGGVPWHLGLSPHAPYTVRGELLDAVVALAQKNHLPLAMHLAESEEEIQLLQTGRGPLRNLLEELGQWESGLLPGPCQPMDYLRQLGKGERAFVVHGNYLSEAEWAFLAEHRGHTSVVFCPSSHAYFAHRPYPLPEMLQQGVRVVLGTDSRASVPECNMLAELRAVAHRFATLPPERILQLATSEPAEALGWADSLGALLPGRQADFMAVALPDRPGSHDPYELLLDSTLPTVATWLAGQKVFSFPPVAPGS